MSGFSKLFTTQNILILFVVLVLLWAFYTYFYTKNNLFDPMTVQDASANKLTTTITDPSLKTTAAQVVPEGDGYKQIPTAKPCELLPKDKNSSWATLKPEGGNGVFMPSMLDAGYMIGLDTIGSTMKNANLQIRSEPIIPKVTVSPWNQSSYENDLGRVPLEIGECRSG